MKLFADFIVWGYIIDLLIMSMLLLSERKHRVLMFLVFWGTAISAISNFPIIVYYFDTRDTYFFFALSASDVIRGAFINLIFLIFWQVGFILGIRMKFFERQFKFNYREEQMGVVFFFFTMAFYLYHYAQGHSYGYSNDLYTSGSEAARSFGLRGAIKNMFVPFLTALLIYYYRRKLYGQMVGFFKHKWVFYGLWGTLIATIFIGLFFDLQRGDIVKPLFFATLVLLYKGTKVTKILGALAIAGFFVIVISPILDILRTPGLYDKEVSAEVLVDLSENERALRNAKVDGIGSLFTFTSIFTQIARKNVMPKTTGAMAKYADREGYAHFKTYFTILFEFVPRFVLKDKPVSLSINKTKEYQLQAIAGRELGLNARVWSTGGASMYWQFWWIGVVIGGVLVGLLWAYTLKIAFYSNSFLLLAMVLNMFDWGQFLMLGLDNYILEIVQNVKLFAMFFIINLLFVPKLSVKNV